MNLIDWYKETVGDDTTNGAAMKAGLVTTTLARQLDKGRLTPETVVAIADAYGRDVLDSLVIAGLITREHVARHGIHAALSAATDRQIADEVWKRLNDGADHATFDEPVRAPHRLAAVSDQSAIMAASDADIDAEVEAQQDEA